MGNRQRRRAPAAKQRKRKDGPGLEAFLQFTGDDLFVVFDGERIAQRGQAGTPEAKTWVPLIDGFTVEDGEGPNGIAISYQDPRAAQLPQPARAFDIAFGTLRYKRGAPKDLPRWVWACECAQCATKSDAERMHGPFKTLREAERNAREVVTLLSAGGAAH